MNDLNPKVYYMIHYYGVKSRIFVFVWGLSLNYLILSHNSRKKKVLHTCFEHIIPSCKLH